MTRDSDGPCELPPGVLLDIEGTMSPIAFVYDIMFPYVRRELEGFLLRWGESKEVREACEAIAHDEGWASVNAWRDAASATEPYVLIQQRVRELMDDDRKSTGLKALQGLIWKAGFDSGELRAELFSDVAPCLEAWFQAGHDLRIYSSGSVTAQRLFFEHTTQGNLLNLFRGHFDTTVGPKRATESYRQITHAFGLSPHQIAFLSDVVEELDAAKAAGLLTILCRRPGNPPVNATHCHHEITCFTQLIPLKKRQQR